MKIKKVLAILLTVTLTATGFAIVPKNTNADVTKNYTLGKTVTGTADATYLYGILMTSTTDTYSFTLSKDMDLTIEFTPKDDDLRYYLDGDDVYESHTIGAGEKSTLKCFAKAGAYTFKVSGGKSKYTFTISESTNYTVKFNQTSGSLDGAIKKTVGFTYKCSYDYAKNNIKFSNSKSKVANATYSLNNDGTGTVTFDPKKIGRTKVTLSLVGGNQTTYTATVKSMVVFIAKGGKMKLTKPIGIKKPKWKSKKKSVVTVKKGKIKAKKGGRTTVIAKKKKSVFRYRVVVTDYYKLGKQAYREIKENVRNPEKFKVYTVYRGYDKNIVSGVKIPVIFIDFGYPNSYGALERGKCIAYYDDVHEMKSFWVDSYADVMKKKKVSVKKIKN